MSHKNHTRSNKKLQQILSNIMWLFWGLFFSPLKIFGVIKVTYRADYLPFIHSPLIIASNHRHPIDPLTIGIAIFPRLTWHLLPFAPYAAPLHRLQRPGQVIAKKIGFIQAVYYLFNVIQIPEGVSFTEKLAPMEDAINGGETVLIFPEGRSYTETTVRPFKNGVAGLHINTKTPIIPCAIHYYKTGWMTRAVVSFGTPFSITDQTAVPLETTAETIRRAVAAQYMEALQSV